MKETPDTFNNITTITIDDLPVYNGRLHIVLLQTNEVEANSTKIQINGRYYDVRAQKDNYDPTTLHISKRCGMIPAVITPDLTATVIKHNGELPSIEYTANHPATIIFVTETENGNITVIDKQDVGTQRIVPPHNGGGLVYA